MFRLEDLGINKNVHFSRYILLSYLFPKSTNLWIYFLSSLSEGIRGAGGVDGAPGTGPGVFMAWKADSAGTVGLFLLRPLSFLF